jgi:hypothetical protein
MNTPKLRRRLAALSTRQAKVNRVSTPAGGEGLSLLDSDAVFDAHAPGAVIESMTTDRPVVRVLVVLPVQLEVSLVGGAG